MVFHVALILSDLLHVLLLLPSDAIDLLLKELALLGSLLLSAFLDLEELDVQLGHTVAKIVRDSKIATLRLLILLAELRKVFRQLLIHLGHDGVDLLLNLTETTLPVALS